MAAADRVGSPSGDPTRAVGEHVVGHEALSRHARAAAALAHAEASVAAQQPPSAGERAGDRADDRAGGRADDRAGGRADDRAAARVDADADPARVAHAICLRQLAMAPRSRGQLREKLRAKSCPDDVAEQVLDRLEAVGLIDDAAFAQTLVRTRRAAKGLASRALASELRAKGVPDELVEGELAGISTESEKAQAYDWAAKKMRTMGGLSAEVQTRRLAAFLARKGYSSSVVVAVVRDTVTAAPEHRRD